MLQLLKGSRSLSTLVLAVLAACGGGGDGGTTPPPPPPTPAIAMSLSASATTLQAGSNTTFTATISRTNFTGAVTVAVSGAPAGVTSNVTNSGDTYTITLTTVASAAAGAYPLTVTASGSGVGNATATYTLTLTAPPAASYTLAVTPATLSVQAGANGQATVNITRVNFTGAVALAVTGSPTGVTTTLGAASVTGDNTTLAIATAANTTPGNYTLTVTGTVAGQTNRTATLALTVTAAPAGGSIALSLTPATLSIAQGGTGSATLNIARTNFTGTVNLAASGAPAGVALTLSAASTTANSVTANFTVAAGTVAGNYTINFEGAGTGITNATAALTLTVTAAAVGSISITATNNTIQQGNSGSLNVFLTRTNYTGSVTLVATGMPTGVTTTYTQPNTGNSGQVTFAVGSSTPTGSYPIVVTASGTGVSNATATGTLTVTGGSSGGGNVTFAFCAPEIPIWVAAQNGAGSWTQVTAGANNTYSFNVTSFGGIAFVTQSSNDYDLEIIYGTLAELSAQGPNRCSGTSTPGTRSVTGTVAGFAGGIGEQVSVSMNVRTAIPAPTAAAPNFSLTQLPNSGALDLVGTRGSIDLMNPLAGVVTNRVFIRRNLNPASGSSVGTVDFNGSDAFAPESRQLTLNGASGEQVVISSLFTTVGGSSVSLGGGVAGSNFTFSAVPAARTVAGDLHFVGASAINLQGSTLVSQRAVSNIFRDPANATMTLGANLTAPTVSSTNAGYARLRAVVLRPSDYPNYWIAVFGQTNRQASIVASGGYLGSAANFDAQIPDFSGVGGWQNVFGPVAGATTTWSVTGAGWIVGNGNNIEGAVSRTALRTGTFTP